jgi:CRISPR-associated endonuclease Csn1
MKTVLGLDLGVTSVGWALVEKGAGSGRLLDGGVRIFISVTEDKTSNLKNQKRREKRGQRVNIRRRRKRRNALKKALVNAKLLPKEILNNEKASDTLNQISKNPYILRTKALSGPLSDYELGRAFLCLGMRRGFLSNRKSGGDSDSKKVQPAIDALQEEILKKHCKTLGEYLSKQPTKRGRYTHRSMFINEFNSIWNEQCKTNAKLSDSLKSQLEHFMFFQNPLKIQKYLVGACSLEPNKRRAAKWQPKAQLLRNWQDVSRIKTEHDGKPLEWKDQKILVDALQVKKTLKWNGVRKLLGQDAETRFNLEESGSLKELKGNETRINLNKALGSASAKLNETAREKILNWLDTSDNTEKLTEKLKRGFDFDQPVIEALCKCSLPSGYFNFSVKACTKLVEVFETQHEPLSYREAGEMAGYVMDELGHVGKVVDRLPEPPQIRNPVVEKALVELRKVVNGIIRRYGKPDAIHLEVARDLKNPKRIRDEIQKRNKEQEKIRDEVKIILQRDFSIFEKVEPSRSDIEKYLLWKECFEDGKGQCPYTGRVISGDMLFTQGIQVEHIIPYSRCFNNSFNNKTLCVIEENARKGNKTPYELYKGTAQYEEVLSRVMKLPYPKRQRFKLKEVPENPDAQRTLNDTRYICKESKRYLQLLGVRVQTSTGQFTAVLRRNWNLNGILNEDGSNTKNREDHRHHFIDAVVVANINAGMVQLISKFSADERMHRSIQAGVYSLKSVFKEPWEGFSLDVVTQIKKIIVSHSPTRKVSGGLHEDTALGLVNAEHGTAFATRVELNKDFSCKKLKSIADKKIRDLVAARLEQFDNEPKRAFADFKTNPLLHVDGKTPIRSVRVHTNDSFSALAGIKQHGKVYAYYRKGNNYKICIYQMPDGKWKGHYLTAFDVKSKNTKPPKDFDAAKLVMELCKNDMVELDWKGTRDYFRLQKMSAPKDTMIFRHHHSTQKSDTERQTLKSASSNSIKELNPIKIEISPIGEVTYVGRSNN